MIPASRAFVNPGQWAFEVRLLDGLATLGAHFPALATRTRLLLLADHNEYGLPLNSHVVEPPPEFMALLLERFVVG